MLKLSPLGFDINNPPPGAWATYTDGVRIKVRRLTAEAFREIKKKYSTTEFRLDPGSRQMVPVEKVDETGFDDAITDYLVEDFDGIGDENGVALPVTLESKQRLLNVLTIKDFVWSCAQSLEVAARATTEDAEKN